MRVLVAVDNANRTLLQEALPAWGHQVVTAADGLAAWELMQNTANEPILLVLDWLLPGMSGFELCQKLKRGKEKSNLYVILLAEANAQIDVTAGLGYGADDFLTKPIKPDEMQSRLALGKRILEYQRSLEQLTNELVDKDQAFGHLDKDGLTGVASSSYFGMRFSEEWRRSIRNGEPLSLIMLDIDFFKDYSETYGQAAGEQCLKTVAHTIAASVSRGGDFVARYDGAEFMVILPNTDSLGALVVAESIRVAVAIQNIEHTPAGINEHITVSAGTVTIIPDKDIQPETMISRVQQTLCMAKSAGHNAVRQVA